MAFSNRKGNILVKQDDGGIFLFTSKDGPRLPLIVQRALIRGRDRWGDTAALTRIIFAELVQKDILSLSGYGISVTPIDNENPIVVVDDRAEKVGFVLENGEQVAPTMSFSNFVMKSPSDIEWDNMLHRSFRMSDFSTINSIRI